MQGSADRDKRSRKEAPEAWTFFREWLRNPLSVAALSPSGKQLAKIMLEPLGPEVRRVIELGGGTGAFTRAVLGHGIAPPDLLVLELNESLHQLLRQRFGEACVVCGDARELPRLARDSGWLDEGPADAVISGLGLLTMSKQSQHAILDAAFAVMQPQGKFVQFTYGPANPVNRDVLETLQLNAERTGFALLNVPPASVYVYTRRRSKAIPARRMPRPRR